MDHLPFGMFADADAYDAREEMGGERGDNTPAEEWVEPMDWTDILEKHNKALDEANAAAEAAEADADADWWEDYDSEDIWFD